MSNEVVRNTQREINERVYVSLLRGCVDGIIITGHSFLIFFCPMSLKPIVLLLLLQPLVYTV